MEKPETTPRDDARKQLTGDATKRAVTATDPKEQRGHRRRR
jgi:hypothetical protein